MIDLAAAQPEICDLHARYTDAVFRQDIDAFRLCFTKSGEWRISGRVLRGRDAIGEAIAGILVNLTRVLITFRTPILALDHGEVIGRTYVDEKCVWKNGDTNINLGRYYERFTIEDGRWRFSWRLFQLLYRGPPDLTGAFYDNPDFGAPPGMPPLDADTDDLSAPG